MACDHSSRSRQEARSRISVPLQPRGDARELRAALRDGLAGLQYGEGEGLRCVLLGQRPVRSDIENLLLYNIDGSGGRSAAASSISFEQASALDDWEYTYAYHVVPPGTGFAHHTHRRVAAEIRSIAVPDGPRDRLLDRVWLAFKEHGDVRVQTDPVAPLALRLRLAMPHRPRSGIAGFIKGLFDGVVAGLAVDEGSSHGSVNRLAVRCGRSPEEICALLGTAPAPLGATRLLAERGAASVDWHPPDDLLVAGSLRLVAAHAPQMTLEGELLEVDPAVSTPRT
jgi:hypothetical protein